MNESRVEITEDWLRSLGFKWDQVDRQPDKHWILWIGGAILEEREEQRPHRRSFGASSEDLGIELEQNPTEYGLEWFCWFRSDAAGRYHRFIHLRHLVYQDELIRLIEGLTGRDWSPGDIIYGELRRPGEAQRLREEHKRLDLQRNEYNANTGYGVWLEQEKDPDRSRALPEHLDLARKAGKAK